MRNEALGREGDPVSAIRTVPVSERGKNCIGSPVKISLFHTLILFIRIFDALSREKSEL